jgi:hypothetical protein
MGEPDQGNRIYRELTPAHIRVPAGADCAEVVFLESARFYRLFKKHPKYDEMLISLRDAMAKRHTVEVGLASLASDVIEEVRNL